MSLQVNSAEDSLITGPGLPPLDVIFGVTPAMRTIRRKLAHAAGTNIPVLIRGANGTGKEVIARLIQRKLTVP